MNLPLSVFAALREILSESIRINPAHIALVPDTLKDRAIPGGNMLRTTESTIPSNGIGLVTPFSGSHREVRLTVPKTVGRRFNPGHWLQLQAVGTARL